MFGGVASAQASVGLGTAQSYAVLAGQTITNTGSTTINGDVGVSPGTAITGFATETVSGTTNAANATALQAKSDLTIAYNDAASRTPSDTEDYPTLGGRTLKSGTYKAASTMALTGTVTLDGEGRSDGIFIFQVGSDLETATGSTVALTNGANACNVFWQVGASAVLNTNTTFVGTAMALTSISVKTGTTVQGRVLAREGSVTLDDNTINIAPCGIPTEPTPTSTTSPTDTTEPTTPTTTETTEPDDSTTPTTTEPSESTTPTTTETTEPSTSVPTTPTTPTTTVTNGLPIIPIPIPIPLLPPGGGTPGGPGQPPVNGGQPPSGPGQPPVNGGQPPVAEGQPPVNGGQPPVAQGQPPVKTGQPPTGGGHIIPRGYPDTGAGGAAAGSSPLKANALVAALVALTLLGSGIAAGQAFRVNRRLK